MQSQSRNQFLSSIHNRLDSDISLKTSDLDSLIKDLNLILKNVKYYNQELCEIHFKLQKVDSNLINKKSTQAASIKSILLKFPVYLQNSIMYNLKKLEENINTKDQAEKYCDRIENFIAILGATQTQMISNPNSNTKPINIFKVIQDTLENIKNCELYDVQYELYKLYLNCKITQSDIDLGKMLHLHNLESANLTENKLDLIKKIDLKEFNFNNLSQLEIDMIRRIKLGQDSLKYLDKSDKDLLTNMDLKKINLNNNTGQQGKAIERLITTEKFLNKLTAKIHQLANEVDKNTVELDVLKKNYNSQHKTKLDFQSFSMIKDLIEYNDDHKENMEKLIKYEFPVPKSAQENLEIIKFINILTNKNLDVNTVNKYGEYTKNHIKQVYFETISHLKELTKKYSNSKKPNSSLLNAPKVLNADFSFGK